MVGMRFHKIWVQQCRATRRIKRHFGVASALDYLLGEKLVNFAAAAERRPEFARELPRFQAAIWIQMCVFMGRQAHPVEAQARR